MPLAAVNVAVQQRSESSVVSVVPGPETQEHTEFSVAVTGIVGTAARVTDRRRVTETGWCCIHRLSLVNARPGCSLISVHQAMFNARWAAQQHVTSMRGR
jgi:hypothetical protein